MRRLVYHTYYDVLFIIGPETREPESLDRNLKYKPRCDCGEFAKRDCGWTSRGSKAPGCSLCNEKDQAEIGLQSLDRL